MVGREEVMLPNTGVTDLAAWAPLRNARKGFNCFSGIIALTHWTL